MQVRYYGTVSYVLNLGVILVLLVYVNSNHSKTCLWQMPLSAHSSVWDDRVAMEKRVKCTNSDLPCMKKLSILSVQDRVFTVCPRQV